MEVLDNEDKSLTDLLTSWELSDVVQNLITSSNLNLNSLKRMTDEDINILIPNQYLVQRINFRWHRINWLKEQQPESFPNKCPNCSTQKSDTIVANVLQETETTEQYITLDTILNDTIKGKYILKLITDKQILDDENRNLLCDLIIDYFMINNIEMLPFHFHYYSNEIFKCFPNEKKELFFLPPKGKLYEKYGKACKIYNKFNKSFVSSLPQQSELPSSSILKRSTNDTLSKINLHKQLSSSRRGKNILQYYKRKHNLTDKFRWIIADQIIMFYKRQNIEMDKEIFLQCSDEIIKLFPNEIQDIYYSINTNDKQEGYLYERYIQLIKFNKTNGQRRTSQHKLYGYTNTDQQHSNPTSGSVVGEEEDSTFIGSDDCDDVDEVTNQTNNLIDDEDDIDNDCDEDDGESLIIPIARKSIDDNEKNQNGELCYDIRTQLMLPLIQILNESSRGTIIQSFYQKNQQLDDKCRKILCELIINQYLAVNDHGIDPILEKMNDNHFKYYSNEIEHIFPNEKSNLYYNIIKNDQNNQLEEINGLLYDEYKNTFELYKNYGVPIDGDGSGGGGGFVPSNSKHCTENRNIKYDQQYMNSSNEDSHIDANHDNSNLYHQIDRVQSISPIFNLKTVLENTIKGRSALNYYGENQSLDNRHRLFICDIICSFFLENGVRLYHKSYKEITKEIQSVFPTEDKSIYYQARVSGIRNPKGKLVHKFNNLVRHYKNLGIIDRSNRSEYSEDEGGSGGAGGSVAVDDVNLSVNPNYCEKDEYVQDDTMPFEHDQLVSDVSNLQHMPEISDDGPLYDSSYCPALDEIICTNLNGKYVLGYYEKNKQLDEKCRKFLCEAIASHFITRNIHLGPKQLEIYAREIPKLFIGEKKESYLCKKFDAKKNKIIKGKLYAKYNNLKRVFGGTRKRRKISHVAAPSTLTTNMASTTGGGLLTISKQNSEFSNTGIFPQIEQTNNHNIQKSNYWFESQQQQQPQQQQQQQQQQQHPLQYSHYYYQNQEQPTQVQQSPNSPIEIHENIKSEIFKSDGKIGY